LSRVEKRRSRNGELCLGQISTILTKGKQSVVAGSNSLLGIETFLSLGNYGLLSPDGLCYSFDSRANGYSRGEGYGVVILKRLSDAIDAGDTIRAVIRSTGSNQDGHTQGITNPSQEAQENLIRDVYQKAGLDLGSTRYFEAHGRQDPNRSLNSNLTD